MIVIVFLLWLPFYIAVLAWVIWRHNRTITPYTDCHIDSDTGIVTARGPMQGPLVLRNAKFPIPIYIHANGAVIKMMITQVTSSYSEPRVEWIAQDARSFVQTHTVEGAIPSEVYE